MGVGPAATNIAAHQLADLIGGARLALGDQADPGTDLAGRAVAAPAVMMIALLAAVSLVVLLIGITPIARESIASDIIGNHCYPCYPGPGAIVPKCHRGKPK